MSVIIKDIYGESKEVEGVRYFTLPDGRDILFYFDNAWDGAKIIRWADFYVIDGKYYKTQLSSLSEKEFKKYLSKNITRSKPVLGIVTEVDSHQLHVLMTSEDRTSLPSNPAEPLKYEVDSLPSEPPKYEADSVSLEPPKYEVDSVVLPPEVPSVDNEYENLLPVIAVFRKVNGELVLNLYSREYEEELHEQYVGEEYGRFKHYYGVKQVGTVKLPPEETLDKLIFEMLSSDKGGQSLRFKNTDNVREDEYFVLDDLLLNYSTQSHRCEDRNVLVRDFIADDYISNNKGRESYNRYSNGNRSQFVGLKRTVFHRNSYEINRDYGESSGRSR